MKLFGTKRDAARLAEKPGRARKADRAQQPPQARNSKQVSKSGRVRKRGRARRALLVALTVILVLGAGVYALIFFNVQPPDLPGFVRPPSGSQDPGDPEPVHPDETGRESFTILVAGLDAVGGMGASYSLTDTLMMVYVDPSEGRVNVVNIPRDTQVDFGRSGSKVNAVLPLSRSVDSLMEEVGKLTGFLPDFYVMVNLRAFSALVDTLGGVRFNVPVRMFYEDPYANPPLMINLSAGYQTIDGLRAIQLVRFRGFPDGDISRIATQQAFLRAIAGELLQIRNVARIGDLAGIFIEHVNTNIPLGNLVWLAGQLMGMDDENLNFYTMPVGPGPGTALVLELEPWLEIVNEHLNPFPVQIEEEHIRVFTRRDGRVSLVGDGLSLTPTAGAEIEPLSMNNGE